MVAGDQKVVSSRVEITAGTSSSGSELMTKAPCIGWESMLPLL
jgi:hypothetical protein